MFGAIVNAVLVVIGSLIGLLVRRVVRGKKSGETVDADQGSGIGKRISDAIFSGIGLCVILIGIDGAIKGAVNGQISDALSGSGVMLADLSGEKTLVIIISIVIGVIIGELIDLDKRINRLGDRLQALMKGRGGNVAQGFVSASLLFCVGSMSIVGPLNSGIFGDHSIQITKGVMDFVGAIVFTSSFGIGVMFSAAFILIYQGLISLLAAYIAPFLTNDVITCMTAVGSLIIIALGLNLLGVTKMKIMNYIPAIFLPILLIPLWTWLEAVI
ncbi:MAG: DUF554 domain-containing protein [Clostridia bacterium]|nr:DUF554 domain-containing protein [Clostridia bacterium]